MSDNEGDQVKHANSLIRAYLDNRERLAVMKREFDASAKRIDDIQDRIERALTKILEGSGLSNLKTEHGTAYPSKKTSSNVSEWTALLAFVQKEEQWQLLNKAVSKTAVAEYMKLNGDIPPPGVRWVEFRTMRVQKAPSSGSDSE